MRDFVYHRPDSLDAARELFDQAEDPRWLAGGQTLIATMKQGMASASDLIDLGAIAGLRGISQVGDTIVTGANTRHGELAADGLVQTHIPALATLATGIGDAAVRNMGTIGGSLANNDPAADLPAAALALGAVFHTDRREIPADDFFVDLFETALDENEILVRIAWPIPVAAGYVKFPQPASRFALAAVFVARFAGSVRVAVTGAGNGVIRLPDLEAALAADFRPEAVPESVIDPADCTGDLHADPDYRAHMVAVTARRAVAAAGPA